MDRSCESHVYSRYRDPRFGLNAVKILPGEYYACNAAEVVVTVLGSCISVCLYESELKIGGMNHFMLPVDRKVSTPSNKVKATARYGDVAMGWLIDEMIKLGGLRKNLSAKIFGGGSVNQTAVDIGQLNVDFIKQYCKQAGIAVTSQDLGGHRARKIYFMPKINRVYVKTLVNLHNQTISEREQIYQRQLSNYQ